MASTSHAAAAECKMVHSFHNGNGGPAGEGAAPELSVRGAGDVVEVRAGPAAPPRVGESGERVLLTLPLFAGAATAADVMVAASLCTDTVVDEGGAGDV